MTRPAAMRRGGQPHTKRRPGPLGPDFLSHLSASFAYVSEIGNVALAVPSDDVMTTDFGGVHRRPALLPWVLLGSRSRAVFVGIWSKVQLPSVHRGRASDVNGADAA